MIEYIKPKKLNESSKIAIIALSGAIREIAPISRAEAFFKNLGYQVELGNTINDADRYLAGNDEERVEELHHYFSRPDIDAIVCARGGYGVLRLIDKIDYEFIKKNPKIFAGYSDISILSAMLLKKSNLVTYSAPMAKGDFGNEDLSQFTVDNFFNAVCTDNVLEFSATKVYKAGIAEGITFGGNLSSIVSLCGIDFLPEQKFVFFVEDVAEPVYKIDKMFTQLFNLPKFRQNLAGIVLGEFTDNGNEIWLDELFREIAENVSVPVYAGFKITHGKDKITIPYGLKSKMENGIFTIYP